MRKLLLDPLTHFTLLGGLLFFAYTQMDRMDPSAKDIIVTQAQQQQIEAAFTRVWRRPPSVSETKGLIDDWVREELANREAMNLGLVDDMIIRRRLRQKYESLMEQIDAPGEPSDEQLRTWYRDRQANYRREPRYTLQQLFFSADRRTDPQADAETALATLIAEPAATRAEVGDAIALARRFADASDAQLAGRLGQAFAGALADLPQGRWSGPVPSAYGYHLVFIETAEPAKAPQWLAIRDTVMRDWRAEQLRNAREARYADLLEQYRLVLEPRQPTVAKP